MTLLFSAARFLSMKKRFLFTPGPTPLPERVMEALGRPIINHRSQDFKDLLGKVRDQLKKVFQTKNEVIILTTSGTGAMEGALSSSLKKTDRVLVVNAGKFGERFEKLSKALGLETDVIQIEWGKSVTPAQIEAKLDKKYAALCIQASETSTGTLHPIEAISKVLQKKSPETLLIVDGITAVGAMNIPADEWKIDILISGSQKAFMLPPGLAFASISEKALEKMKSSDIPKFYLDFQREHKSILENQTAFTPAISLVVALHEALTMLLDEGLPLVFSRHEKLAESSRAALKALGLTLASEAPSVACTAAFLPNSINGKTFLKNIRDKYGFTIAGGQDEWEGKAIRLSHLGYYTAFDLMNAIAAMGRELNREGIKSDTAKALSVFMDTYDL
ncbi:MAG: Class aminotransferase [Bacteriovoracaceae bacterium]|nr:Class aminotransferase [Bacteriovoracaceae bacterium]